MYVMLLLAFYIYLDHEGWIKEYVMSAIFVVAGMIIVLALLSLLCGSTNNDFDKQYKPSINNSSP